MSARLGYARGMIGMIGMTGARGRIGARPGLALALAVMSALAWTPASAEAAEELLLELHYKPRPGLQLAIWLEDRDGAHVQDVLVTQATGKLGIGNRPGLWNFVSSWRAPYGPRPSVLPIWAHRRGKSYPKVVFFDADPGDEQSLGWHENTSTAETYYCRPLTADEDATISVDTMTCPSPAVFKTDKGRFAPGETSPYPPRNDLIAFEAKDSPDAVMFAGLNDLDGVTAATPPGDAPEYVIVAISAEAAGRGPLTAWIEASREHDENDAFQFDREHDHFVDERLESYGVEYLGQPSVVYRVDFDPRARGFTGTTALAGYGDWDGATGTIHPPDAKISTSGGSGADRLAQYTLRGETFRFGVYAYGDDPDAPDDGWGHCVATALPAVEDLRLEALDFDTVRVHYTLPTVTDPAARAAKLHVYMLPGEEPLTTANLGAAVERSFAAGELAAPGAPGFVDVDQLWGNFTYQVGVAYADRCTSASTLVTAEVTTPAQEFQQVDGLCFVSTAAYGAAWLPQVQALRWFRDAYLKTSPIGRDFVRFYYTFSPPIAGVIARQPVLRGMVRVVLQPVADLARLSTR